MATTTNRWASGDWLERRLISFVAVLMLIGTVGSIGVLLATGHGTLDFLGRPQGTDFSSFWTAGRMALDGQAPQAYDWTAHFAVQRKTHGIEMYFPWSYPPTFLLVTAGLAMLPYVPALLVWQTITLLAAVAVLWTILPSRRALFLGLAFPAVLICLGHGQTGFLIAALLAGGVVALPRSQVLAGVLFGLVAVKPQFGVLLPFVLAAGGYWRAIAAAAATVTAVVTATLLIWDWPVWQAFFQSVHLTRALVFEAGDTGFEKFQSAFAWVRLWGGPAALAYGAQALVASGVLAACCWVWRGEADLRLKGAALLTGTLLFSPYTLDYDLAVFGMAIALFAAHGLEAGFQPWDRTVLAAGWFMPVLARSIAKWLYLPVGFLVLLAVFALIVERSRQVRRIEAANPGEAAPGVLPA
jgi:alpha-1,2-mannosyltransferase